MSLTDQAQQHVLPRVREFTRRVPAVTIRVRTFPRTARKYVPDAIKPLTEAQATYDGLREELRRYEHKYTEAERELMLEYAWSLLFGDETKPANITVPLITAVWGMIDAERTHQRKVHYIRALVLWRDERDEAVA